MNIPHFMHEKKTTLFEHIAGGASAYEEFRALRDVSIRVKKGETLGIIGENGRIAPFLELRGVPT